MIPLEGPDSDFFIGSPEGPESSVTRAMVSLGPLSKRRYCTYRCPFCYVNGDFDRYANRSPGEICDWLSARRAEFNIVYVSGDTDSFARPRTGAGLRLLEELTDLDVDILFTTRYAFEPEEMESLARIAKVQRLRSRLFVGCISALGVDRFDLEPRPVPSAEMRLASLEEFAKIDVVPVLALRPLMPTMSAQDVLNLLNAAPASLRHVVSGWLYLNPNSTSTAGTIETHPTVLDFDIGQHSVTEYRNEGLMTFLHQECDKRGIRCYLRSPSLIYDLRVGSSSSE
jgi:hypothetical protein